jgi:hypothetical protein
MLKVIGAGFGRTGTHSLGRAFEILGFGPCYNIREVAKNPGHTENWKRALDGKPVDWSLLFRSYQSAVEWPAVSFLPEIIQQFPDSKVVLTLREPDSWFDSANNTIFNGLELSAYNPDPVKRERSGVFRRLILERTFAGKYREKEYATDVYRSHNQRVVEIVPKERLLQFDVKDGWEPLCEFLERPIQTEPFPWLHERTEFVASEPEWAKKARTVKDEPE